MSYVIITEGPDTPPGGSVAEYGTQEEAHTALQQYLAYLKAEGATISGNLTQGYTAVWQEDGRALHLHVMLEHVQ